MELKAHEENGVCVVALFGRLDEMATAPMEEELRRLVQEDARQVVLDMAGVEYISSSGLRVLLMAHRALARHGGSLKLCSVTPFVAEVFDISNFSQVFDIYPGPEQAVKAFGAQS